MLRMLLRLAGAGLLAATAAIHLDLYLTGYRSIPTIGWLFLLQVIAAFALAAAVLATAFDRGDGLVPRLVAAAGAGFAVATLGGYLLSLWTGLFGFTEVRTMAGTVAGVIEIAAFAVLAVVALAPASRAAQVGRTAGADGAAGPARGARVGRGLAGILGLQGETPETVNTVTVRDRVEAVRADGVVRLLGKHDARLAGNDLVLHRRQSLPFHPNGMRFYAYGQARGAGEALLRERTYYSVGGGFVVDEQAAGADRIKPDDTAVQYPFLSGAELLARCAQSGQPVSGVMLANETAWRDEDHVRAGLLKIWRVMQECVSSGYAAEGVLPGGLKVPRRAPELYRRLCAEPYSADPLRVLDWVNLFALAVNEENAAGGRVVTAPTNGAAGVLPAVLHYYRRFVPGASDDGVVRFLLAAGAIGVLYKENASISGAEVGCQGEVGSACSMAAGALCELLGGTPQQVENAAEIGMEHNLGLTCDPVGGLVQVPCIERNAMAAVKAINAARIALRGSGQHIVSLDKVIKTMRETGADMKVKYKETARGGLAVNVIEC